MKILVVDDERGVREACAVLLARSGHSVTTAECGDDAKAVLSPEHEIVLTDIHMPGDTDGIALARHVRTTTAADVIIMTAVPQLETAIQAMRDGAYDYLIKPFSRESLELTVRRCVERRQLSMELALEKALRAEISRAHEALQRMERVRAAFGQFATPEVAEFVLSQPEAHWRRAERRTVSVLFADVRGFTPFAARSAPEDVVLALNELYEVFVEAVRRHGGIVNKFMGDGVMAVFGAPTALAADAAAAAAAALDARQAATALARQRSARGLEPLEFGFGINTGEVLAGCIGTSERAEYGIIGHAVNVAARLESHAEKGQILLGPSTQGALDGAYELRAVGPLELQGLAGPMWAAELVGPR